MKIKTFKKGSDKEVNEFLAEHTVLGFNILQDGDILVQYKDEVFSDKDLKDYYKKELADNLQKKAKLELDVEYEDKVQADEKTGVRKREINDSIARLEVEEKILLEKLA